MDRKFTSSTSASSQRQMAKALGAPMVSTLSIKDATTTTSRPARRSTTLLSGAHSALARHQASSNTMLTGSARNAPNPKRWMAANAIIAATPR
jgi:hypothetical protein